MYIVCKMTNDGGYKQVGKEYFQTLQDAQLALLDAMCKKTRTKCNKYIVKFVLTEENKKRSYTKRPATSGSVEKINDLESCIIHNDMRTRREDTLDDNCHEWAQMY